MKREIVISKKDIYNLLRFGESKTRVLFNQVEYDTQESYESITLKVENE